MSLLSASSLLSALETALVSGLSAFAGAVEIQGAVTGKGVVAAATAAGIGALYTFTKQLGAIQATPAVAPPVVPSSAPVVPAVPAVTVPAGEVFPPKVAS